MVAFYFTKGSNIDAIADMSQKYEFAPVLARDPQDLVSQLAKVYLTDSLQVLEQFPDASNIVYVGDTVAQSEGGSSEDSQLNTGFLGSIGSIDELPAFLKNEVQLEIAPRNDEDPVKFADIDANEIFHPILDSDSWLQSLTDGPELVIERFEEELPPVEGCGAVEQGLNAAVELIEGAQQVAAEVEMRRVVKTQPNEEQEPSDLEQNSSDQIERDVSAGFSKSLPDLAGNPISTDNLDAVSENVIESRGSEIVQSASETAVDEIAKQHLKAQNESSQVSQEFVERLDKDRWETDSRAILHEPQGLDGSANTALNSDALQDSAVKGSLDKGSADKGSIGKPKRKPKVYGSKVVTPEPVVPDRIEVQSSTQVSLTADEERRLQELNRDLYAEIVNRPVEVEVGDTGVDLTKGSIGGEVYAQDRINREEATISSDKDVAYREPESYSAYKGIDVEEDTEMPNLDILTVMKKAHPEIELDNGGSDSSDTDNSAKAADSENASDSQATSGAAGSVEDSDDKLNRLIDVISGKPRSTVAPLPIESVVTTETTDSKTSTAESQEPEKGEPERTNQGDSQEPPIDATVFDEKLNGSNDSSDSEATSVEVVKEPVVSNSEEPVVEQLTMAVDDLVEITTPETNIDDSDDVEFDEDDSDCMKSSTSTEHDTEPEIGVLPLDLQKKPEIESEDTDTSLNGSVDDQESIAEQAAEVTSVNTESAEVQGLAEDTSLENEIAPDARSVLETNSVQEATLVLGNDPEVIESSIELGVTETCIEPEIEHVEAEVISEPSLHKDPNKSDQFSETGAEGIIESTVVEESSESKDVEASGNESCTTVEDESSVITDKSRAQIFSEPTIVFGAGAPESGLAKDDTPLASSSKDQTVKQPTPPRKPARKTPRKVVKSSRGIVDPVMPGYSSAPIVQNQPGFAARTVVSFEQDRLNRVAKTVAGYTPHLKQVPTGRAVTRKSGKRVIRGGRVHIPKKVIVVGSMTPKSGCSSMAYNIACGFGAEFGYKVLLMDLDILNPRMSIQLYKDLNLNPHDTCGIDSVLQIQPDAYLANIDIYTNHISSPSGEYMGFIRGNASYSSEIKRILTTANFISLIERLNDIYNAVVIDIGNCQNWQPYQRYLVSKFETVMVYNCLTRRTCLDSLQGLQEIATPFNFILGRYKLEVNPIEIEASLHRRFIGKIDDSKFLRNKQGLIYYPEIDHDGVSEDWKSLSDNILHL